MSLAPFEPISKPPKREKKPRAGLKRTKFVWKPDAKALERMKAWNRRKCRINPKSAKKRADDRQWQKVFKERLIETGGMCVIKSPVCTRIAVDPGHRKPRGRGGKSVKANNDPTCRACHDYLHEHPKWAEENGHMLPSWKEARDTH